jgi:hypothetical protein
MPFTIRAHIIEAGQDHQPPIARTIKGNLRDAQQWLSDRAADYKELAWGRGQIKQAKSLATIQEELAQLRSPHYSSTDITGAKFEIWPQED